MNYIIVLFLLFSFLLSGQESSTLEEKMNSYEEKKKIEWRINPLRDFESDKYFYGISDPNNYRSKFWFGELLNKKELYGDKNFAIDKVVIFHTPQLATELAPIAFSLDDFKHRFKIGVAFAANFYFAHYQNGYDRLYGTSFLFGTHLQVEAYFDYIFNNKLKLRISPLKHICYHMGGDILGDPSLIDPNNKKFKDVGFEQMHLSLHYRYGWLSFYGGTAFAITGFKKSNIVNLFNIYAGSDLRVPIWGEISFITGLYFAMNYDEFNDIQRTQAGGGYPALSSTYIWRPDFVFSLGFEVYRFAIALKYEYVTSKSLYSFEKMENKIGLEASLFF